MAIEILERGTAVKTKRGPGYIVKVDTVSYTSPLYHVLLTSSKHAGEIVYTSDPRITPELYPSPPEIPIEELHVIRAELVFSIKRNLMTGVVTCPQCRTQYRKIGDTEILNIESGDVAFYCKECGERL